MRILSVGAMYPPHDLGGGYELTWASSVRHLRAGGHEVRVLATDYLKPGVAPDAGDSDVHRELRSYWDDHEFPRRSLRERVELERTNAAILARHLEELRPDVVNWWQMGTLSLGLIERVRRAGLPAVGVVGDEWMVWGPRADGWFRPFRTRRLTGRVAERLTGLPTRADLSSAATWLFNSALTRDHALEAAGPLADARVVHPGIEAELFEPAPDRPWGWRLLYVGRMDPRKGVHVAVDALESLPEAATLRLLGSGDAAYEDELRARIESRGLAGRVTLDRVEREAIPAAYAEADAVVFPVQWEEPWGLVPLEAMAVGRPVVATGTGGSAEYLRHDENCLVYAPRDDPAALAEALRRLAGDGELRARLRVSGLDTAARFTARAYDEAIESAIVEVARA